MRLKPGPEMKKPAPGRVRVLMSSGVFVAYTLARPAPVGWVISTSTRIERSEAAPMSAASMWGRGGVL
ncbi:hypothetical protein SMJ63A_20129 [Stenotrophomonas geniculata]|nr:protein of unknown function [Stenotrophomonas maltophilia]